MQDYKIPWNRNVHIQFEHDPIRDSNPIATLFWLVIFGAMAVLLLYALVQAIEEEVKIQESYYSQQATLRPMAYRKASPTHEQMWAMDHFAQVQEVMKAGGQ